MNTHQSFKLRSRGAAGFTLLEVMVSLLLFLVVSATMANAFVSHLKRNTNSEIKSEGIGAAQQVLDVLRLSDPGSLPSSGSSTQNVTIGGSVYVVTTTYCPIATYCASVNNRHVRVKVAHKNQQIYETETVFTRLK